MFNSSTNWIALSDATLVYSGTISPVNSQWVEVTFTTPFNYNGVDNLVVTVVETKIGYTSSSSLAPTFRSYNGGANSRGIHGYQDGTPINISNPNSTMFKYLTTNIPQLQFEGVVSSCSIISDISWSNLTANGIYLSWTTASGDMEYEYESRELGAPGSGATGIVDQGISTTNTISFSNLDLETEYFFM